MLHMPGAAASCATAAQAKRLYTYCLIASCVVHATHRTWQNLGVYDVLGIQARVASVTGMRGLPPKTGYLKGGWEGYHQGTNT